MVSSTNLVDLVLTLMDMCLHLDTDKAVSYPHLLVQCYVGEGKGKTHSQLAVGAVNVRVPHVSLDTASKG